MMNVIDVFQRALARARRMPARWGQSAAEYIVFLGTISALLIFSSPALVDMRRTVNDTFVCAARRILSDGRWMSNSALPRPCE